MIFRADTSVRSRARPAWPTTAEPIALPTMEWRGLISGAVRRGWAAIRLGLKLSATQWRGLISGRCAAVGRRFGSGSTGQRRNGEDRSRGRCAGVGRRFGPGSSCQRRWSRGRALGRMAEARSRCARTSTDQRRWSGDGARALAAGAASIAAPGWGAVRAVAVFDAASAQRFRWLATPQRPVPKLPGDGWSGWRRSLSGGGVSRWRRSSPVSSWWRPLCISGSRRSWGWRRSHVRAPWRLDRLACRHTRNPLPRPIAHWRTRAATSCPILASRSPPPALSCTRMNRINRWSPWLSAPATHGRCGLPRQLSARSPWPHGLTCPVAFPFSRSFLLAASPPSARMLALGDGWWLAVRAWCSGGARARVIQCPAGPRPVAPAVSLVLRVSRSGHCPRLR